MWRLLKKALQLDIFDVNYAWASEELDRCSQETFGTRRSGAVWRIASFFGHLLREAVVLPSLFQSANRDVGVLVFATTANQRSSLLPLVRELTDARLGGGSPYATLDIEEQFPSFLAYILSLPFFPMALFHWYRSTGYRKRTFHFNFDHYWLAYGYYLAASIWLGRLDPQAVVVANDHSMPNRVIVKVAKQKQIPSVYIQHASVTSKFPALAFDYALLEGADALQKYENAGSSTAKVFLVGMPKLDEYCRQRNNRPAVQSVGICTNTLDPLPRVRELCARLQEEFPSLGLFLRPHPGDKRQIWELVAEEYGMVFSDSKGKSSFRFLTQIDAIIAGDSSILLEAALMNVFPIYYDFSEMDRDWYRFRRAGLVDYAAKPEDVCRAIEELSHDKPNVLMKTKHYCATVGTRYDGRSSKLAAEVIRAVASGREVPMGKWRRIPDVQLEAYELAV